MPQCFKCGKKGHIKAECSPPGPKASTSEIVPPLLVICVDEEEPEKGEETRRKRKKKNEVLSLGKDEEEKRTGVKNVNPHPIPTQFQTGMVEWWWWWGVYS